MSYAGVITFAGNNSGIYSAPGITRLNTLMIGQALWAEAGTNYSNAPYVLFPKTIDSTNGWHTDLGQITDPKKVDWRGYQITWVYL